MAAKTEPNDKHRKPKLMADKSSSILVRLVEERALLKELEEEKNKKQPSPVPYIPDDCISNVLVRLPLDSLQRSRFVCKPWYKIIYSPKFIDAHFSRAETVLIFLKRPSFHFYTTTSVSQEKPDNTFSVEARVYELQSVHLFQRPFISASSEFHMKFMVIKNGRISIGDFNTTCLGEIRAACNGLIILDEIKKGGLIVMNPVTREMGLLPLGTLYPSHKESYGLSFCQKRGDFKLVHLFMDDLNFLGCEVLILGTRSWKMVNGPAFGLISWFGYEPISALGALHWIPHLDHNEYILSMTMDDEKFHKILLPKTSRSTDRIVELSGLLGFVTHQEMNQIDIWSLKNVPLEDWTKLYTITVGCIKDMVPLYFSRFDVEMIFLDKDGSLFAFDFQLEVMRKIDMKKEEFPDHGRYYPHVNSLVSWQKDRHQNVGG